MTYRWNRPYIQRYRRSGPPLALMRGYPAQRRMEAMRRLRRVRTYRRQFHQYDRERYRDSPHNPRLRHAGAA